MGLGGALVDRARVVRNIAAREQRVTGSTVLAPVESAWFRARLELPAGNESPAPENGRVRQVRTPTLMFEEFDEDNEAVDLTADDRVEVDSPELGRSMWQVIAPAQPIRKKRAVIGKQVTLRKIENRQLARPVANAPAQVARPVAPPPPLLARRS